MTISSASTPRSGPDNSQALPYINARAVASVPWRATVDALEAALLGGFDVAAAAPRSVVPVAAGHLLLMPSELPDDASATGYVGIKVAGVAPANPAQGLPRIQGTFLLMDGPTLRPLAIIDGTALTTLRTPAVSALAARYLAPRGRCKLVVFGAGPQAQGHIRAISEECELSEIIVISRTVEHATTLATSIGQELKIPARVGEPDDVGSADIVVCATTATEPVFAADAIGPAPLIVAVGSHERDVVEFDPAVLIGAQVVVEDQQTALREAGEVVAGVSECMLEPTALIPLADIVRGIAEPRATMPRVFKSVGMGWEDLVAASAILKYLRSQGAD